MIISNYPFNRKNEKDQKWAENFGTHSDAMFCQHSFTNFCLTSAPTREEVWGLYLNWSEKQWDDGHIMVECVYNNMNTVGRSQPTFMFLRHFCPWECVYFVFQDIPAEGLLPGLPEVGFLCINQSFKCQSTGGSFPPHIWFLKISLLRAERVAHGDTQARDRADIFLQFTHIPCKSITYSSLSDFHFNPATPLLRRAFVNGNSWWSLTWVFEKAECIFSLIGLLELKRLTFSQQTLCTRAIQNI